MEDKLQALNDQFDAMTTKKKELEDNIDLCSKKLDRAEKLIGGLGGEKDRWTQAADTLTDKYVHEDSNTVYISDLFSFLQYVVVCPCSVRLEIAKILCVYFWSDIRK